LTNAEESKFDAFHRKQLRRVLGIISNKKAYKKTGEEPVSLTAKKDRWSLFGHILRRDQQIPAYKAMAYHFNNQMTRVLGGNQEPLYQQN